MDARPVAVVTQLDPTADMVIEELARREVPVIRFDTGDFPHSLTISASFGAKAGLRGSMATPTRVADLTRVRSLFHRRPSGLSFPDLAGQDAAFAAAEARNGLLGVLAGLPDCRYVNHPRRVADAELKPLQLATAVELGFAIPATLITNDPDRARTFVKDHDRVVYKTLRATPYRDETCEARTVWVREVTADELDDSIRATMHVFQELVAKTADLRVTVIADEVFCVRIDSTLPEWDWRYDYRTLTYTPIDAPAELAEPARVFLDRFGLEFGCFDFAVDHDGRPVFLECNPNGQWAWLEEATGLPMAATFADLLERGRP